MTIAAAQPLAFHDGTEHQLEDLERAAAQIQRWWRKYHYLMHQQATAEEKAAANVQLEHAAARIQRWWRKCHSFLSVAPRGGKQVDGNVEIRLQKAAARIQRWWRRYHHRDQIRRTEAPSTTPTKPVIQLAEAEIAAEVESGIVDVEAAAARRIQRWWRNSPRPHKKNVEEPVPDELLNNEEKKNNNNDTSRQTARTADNAARRIQRWWRKFSDKRLNTSAKDSSDIVKSDLYLSSTINSTSDTVITSDVAARRIQRWWRRRQDVRRA